MRVVDLSLTISPSTRVFPGSPPPSFVPWTSFSKHGYDSEAVFLSTHTGTHMDAPSHFVPGRSSIDRIPTSRFVVEAVLARLPKKADQLVEDEDLDEFDLKKGEAIVVATGWEKHLRSKDYMTRNPGLSADAARFLVRKQVSLVAIDGPSIDAGLDTAFSAHNILLAKDILAVENLCNMSRITKDRFTLVITPLKLQGSTGSPVRALAIL